jgi:Tol biopolymer transport system component
MNKIRSLVSSLAGLLALMLLATGLTWLLSTRETPPAQQVVSTVRVLPTVQAVPTMRKLPTATMEVSPIATATPEEPLPQPVLEIQPFPREVLAGEKIGFLRAQDLWIVNVGSRALVQVTVSGNVTDIYGWSYDGSQLLLGVGERSVLLETDMPSGMDLWVVDTDGPKALQLTEGLEVLPAAWSPIDNRVVYGTKDGKIHLVNGDGTGHQVLLADDDGMNYLGTWSPDGSQIAYRTWISDSDTVHLMVLDLADRTRRQLTSEESFFVGYLYSFDIQWTLSGQRLLFQSRREPGTSVWWVIAADGSNLTHLENETMSGIRAYSQWAPRSPVADRVAFFAYDSSFNQVVGTMDFEGYIEEVARGSFPTWSPRGDRMAYVGEDDALWIIDLDDKEATRFSDVAERPYWSD